jgi:NitT/TauT family transport system substrate-binding protein
MRRPSILSAIKLVGALAFCIAASACARVHDAPEQPPIKIATYLWPGSFWIDVAVKKGWFAEAGLNVERVNVRHKYFEGLDDLATGRLDGIGFSQFDLVRHVAAGEDLVGIAALDYSVGAEALIARPGVTHLTSLKGKRIALKRGTYMEYLLSIAAEREGLSLSDVILIDREQDGAIADFSAGKVDAIMVWEPYVSQALAEGGVSLFSTADFPGLTYSIFTVRRQYIDTHPAQVAALIDVWHRSEHFVLEHPQETSEIVAHSFGEPLATVQNLMHRVRVLDLADNRRAFSYSAGFESLHGSWRRMDDFLLERGGSTTPVDSPEHLSSRFIASLE